MRFIRVIPVLTTPLGLDGFDYLIPEGMLIAVGDLVRVPFRRGSTYGLVAQLLDHSPFAKQAKQVQDVVASGWLDARFITFLEACARHTFCSMPSILKTFFHALPKRLPAFEGRRPVTPTLHQSQTVWTPFLREELQKAMASAQAQTGQTLVLVPWKLWLSQAQELFPEVEVYGSELNDGDRFAVMKRFLAGESKCVVTTRIGAWLACAADRVIVLEPENDDYKQDEQTPRLDTRWMVKRAWQLFGFDLLSLATTPTPGKSGQAVTIPVDLRLQLLQTGDKPLIPCIQSESLRFLLEHEGPRVILHPVKQWSARIACWECHWQATCERCHQTVRHATTTEAECVVCHHRQSIPLQCPSCGGFKLHKSVPGMEKLKQAWGKHYAEETVEWRDLSNESAYTPLPEGSMVLVTLPELFSGHGEDIRRGERLCVNVRRFAALCAASKATLLLQVSEEEANQWSAWLTAEGHEAWQTKELKERAAFGYPPASRLVKAIFRGSMEKAGAWLRSLPHNVRALAQVRGPFPVDMRTLKQQERAVIHFVFPPETPDSVLLPVLTPLASHVMIDLDPIAFYR